MISKRKIAKERRSGRLRGVLKAASKRNIVDDDTRKLVKANRLAALENDNYEEEATGEAYVDDDEDEDVYSTAPSKKKKKGKKDSKRQKLAREKSLDFISTKTFEQILFDESEEEDGIPTYEAAAAAPSMKAPRLFCSVCGFKGKYSCTRCGMQFCSLRCDITHKETRCLKFTE
mmetsp:Transcript_46892/g.92298  ORF Transcript_46892/g.92298 Transcript_46892/m.92298 type:complete len:174 (-) Transcript_46892:360-881(-)